jgi:8-oxo-dGTP pyrophosphatase MutT (NUDIX family)
VTPDELAAAVAARRPVDEREARSIERFLAELARLERPYDEHADPVHVTGSAIVVSPRGVVLHLHKRMQRWFQPGGHIDPGETPAEGALREAVEETGLPGLRHPLDGPHLVHVDAHDGPKGHFHLDTRYLIVSPTTDDPTPPSGESPDCRWFSWDQAIAVADEGLAGLLEVLETYVDR